MRQMVYSLWWLGYGYLPSFEQNRRSKTSVLQQENEFFDPRDLVQVKYEMIRRVRTDDGTVAGAVQSFGFSRPSFYQAHAAFEQEGLMGLVPKKRGPRTRHKLGSEVMAFIEDQ